MRLYVAYHVNRDDMDRFVLKDWKFQCWDLVGIDIIEERKESDI